MIKLIRKLVLSFMIILSISAQAQDTIGSMKMNCELPIGNPIKTFCFSYISGVMDVLIHYNLTHKGETTYSCFPEGTTPRQGAAILVKWANENPEQHHKLAIFGITHSLQKAYPCSENEKP
jgi:hypothetical protein